MMSTQFIVLGNQQRLSLKWFHPGVGRVRMGAAIDKNGEVTLLLTA